MKQKIYKNLTSTSKIGRIDAQTCLLCDADLLAYRVYFNSTIEFNFYSFFKIIFTEQKLLRPFDFQVDEEVWRAILVIKTEMEF